MILNACEFFCLALCNIFGNVNFPSPWLVNAQEFAPWLLGVESNTIGERSSYILLLNVHELVIRREFELDISNIEPMCLPSNNMNYTDVTHSIPPSQQLITCYLTFLT